jgi:hypothetical protein
MARPTQLAALGDGGWTAKRAVGRPRGSKMKVPQGGSRSAGLQWRPPVEGYRPKLEDQRQVKRNLVAPSQWFLARAFIARSSAETTTVF